MKSEENKKTATRRQRTSAVTTGFSNPGVDPPVVKDNGRPTKPGRAGGGKFLAVTAPRLGPPAPEDILIDVDTDGDGMAFRFTWG